MHYLESYNDFEILLSYQRCAINKVRSLIKNTQILNLRPSLHILKRARLVINPLLLIGRPISEKTLFEGQAIYFKVHLASGDLGNQLFYTRDQTLRFLQARRKGS